MSKYVLGLTVGKPGQTSALVIVSRGRELGPIEGYTMLPKVTRTLVVDRAERLPAGLKDSEIAAHINHLLGQAPLSGNMRILLEHAGGAPAIDALRAKLRPHGYYSYGISIEPDTGGEQWANGLRRVSVHQMVSYMVPVCQDAELRISAEFSELSAQLLTADADQPWRAGDQDLASALFIAAWFSRGMGSEAMGHVLRESMLTDEG